MGQYVLCALEAEALVVLASPSSGYRLGPELARFAGQEECLAGMLLRTCAEVSTTLRANGHAPDLHATSLATLGNDLATV